METGFLPLIQNPDVRKEETVKFKYIKIKMHGGETPETNDNLRNNILQSILLKNKLVSIFEEL